MEDKQETPKPKDESGCEVYTKILKDLEGIPTPLAEECSKAPPDEFNVLDMMKTNAEGSKRNYLGKYNPESFWKQFGHVYPMGFFHRTDEKKAGSPLELNVEVILARLNIIKPKKVLEVGCGFGRILPYIALFSPGLEEVVGVDFSPTMIDQTKTYFGKIRPELAKKIKVMVGDARELPFEDNQFDVVYTHVCLTHIPPKFISKVTKEISRVAKNWIIHVERFAYPYEHPNQHRWSHMLVPYYLDLGWEVHDYDIAMKKHQTKVLTLRK